MNIITTLTQAAALMFAVAAGADIPEHPGGTDRDGCHDGATPNHCR